MGESFPQIANIVEGFKPVDLQTGANNGDYVSLKNYHSCAVVFMSAVGTAAQDPTLTLQQAQDVAGTGVKDLNFTAIYRKQAATDLSSTGTWTRTTQTAANTFTNGTSAEEDLIWIVTFEDMELDADGGFDVLRATVADNMAAAQLGVLFYVLFNPRHAQETLLTAIAD